MNIVLKKRYDLFSHSKTFCKNKETSVKKTLFLVTRFKIFGILKSVWVNIFQIPDLQVGIESQLAL